jgi:3-oxoacyl-[acyl-carrier-protein] synthase-3
MLMLPVRIAGLGAYLPERRVSSAELERRLGVEPGWIARATGVEERRYAGGETSAAMGARAGRAALDDAGLDVGEVDLIIGASAAPQQAIPCTAALVQRELQAPEGRSLCFDVNATCLSFLVAFQAAAQLLAAGAYRTALIYSSEIASLSLNMDEPESAGLFGDAAAAVVLRRSAPDEPSALWHAAFATYSSGSDLTECLGGGTLHHPNSAATVPAMNTFHMDGPGVFRQAIRVMPGFLDGFFAGLGWGRDEIDVVVPHQASRHALEQLSRRLGFRPEQVYSNLRLRGNCVAASTPLALAEAVAEGRVTRGQRVLLAGTGAGLTLGALAITF